MKSAMRSLCAAILLLALPSGTSLAAPPPPPQDIVVVAPKDPKVAATFPANGAATPGGTLVLKIVFDQPMTPDAWSYGRAEGGDFPDCLKTPRLLTDQRTFVLLCSVATRHSFALKINAAPDFVSAAGRSAPPFLWRFTTTDAPPTLSLHDALAQAGLTDADDPIMGWKGDAGVSDEKPKPREPSP